MILNSETIQSAPNINEDVRKLWEKVFFSLKGLSFNELKESSEYFHNYALKNNIPSLVFASQQLVFLKKYGAQNVNIGGTCSCGKNTVAEELVKLTGWIFRDADTFHSEENIEKMSKGFFLNNEDRIGFLSGIKDFLSITNNISSCSALLDSYRAFLAGQEIDVILKYEMDKAWRISNPNFGLVQIIVSKPYEVALQQLDDSNTGKAPKRMFNGKPHYINVTRDSEEQAKKEGRVGFLQNQYDLLGDTTKINPWEAIVIDSEKFRSSNGSYDNNLVKEFLLKLPISFLKSL